MQQWQFINNFNQLNMFRVVVSSILRKTTLCLQSAGDMSPAGSIVGALYHKLQTQSSVPENGRNFRPKHVKLIEAIDKLSLLHLVGCLYYCINDARSQ